MFLATMSYINLLSSELILMFLFHSNFDLDCSIVVALMLNISHILFVP